MFLDTSGFLCCLDPRDVRHAEAVTHYNSAHVRMTHNYVMAELVALAEQRGLSRKATLEFLVELETDKRIEKIWIDRQTHCKARELLETQLDKKYSLCDAVSFVLMRDRNISEALTTDGHFDQAGFRRLLPRS